MLKTIAPLSLPVVALAASAYLLSACDGRKATPDAPAPEVSTKAPPELPKPAPPPVMSRAQLLEAVDAAAAAYAAGESGHGSDLVGRRFAVRQAFGCLGPSPRPTKDAPGDGVAHWTWSADGKSIQIFASPGDWIGSPLIAGGSQTWEAAEGFWLDRPWLRSEACPGREGDPLSSGPELPSPQTVGIAAVFEAQGSRLGRRNGRDYSFTVRADAGKTATAPSGGYRLVLEGRLTAFEDGDAIHCRASSPQQRPVCVAAAVVDRVAFEDASGATVSEWR